MNRRKFTIKSLLGLAGISILPVNTLFSKSQNPFIDIGFPSEHIRHGNFNDDSFTSIPELGLKLKRDLFYKNGIDKCPDNLDNLVTTIEYKNKKHSFFNTTTEIIKGGLKVHYQKILSYNKTVSINSNKGMICIVSGDIKVNELVTPINKGLLINSPTTITGNGEIMLIEFHN